MGKQKTIIVVKPHYVGTQSLNEAFEGILKKQIQNSVALYNNQNSNIILKDTVSYDKIDIGISLSEG